MNLGLPSDRLILWYSNCYIIHVGFTLFKKNNNQEIKWPSLLFGAQFSVIAAVIACTIDIFTSATYTVGNMYHTDSLTHKSHGEKKWVEVLRQEVNAVDILMGWKLNQWLTLLGRTAKPIFKINCRFSSLKNSDKLSILVGVCSFLSQVNDSFRGLNA